MHEGGFLNSIKRSASRSHNQAMTAWLVVILILMMCSTLSDAAGNADVDLASFSSSVGFKIKGAASSDVSGFAVSGGGDFNGDGIDDVLIGAYGADPNTLAAAGTSYVIFGSSTGFPAAIELLSLNTAGTTTGFAIFGPASLAQSGYSVGNAGDVNGDTVDDIIVGAPTATIVVGGVTRANAGLAYVVFGRKYTNGATSYTNINLNTIGTIGTSQAYSIWGSVAVDTCGFSVSKAGDVNQDGLGDVIVSSLVADPVVGTTRTSAGISYVVFGRSNVAYTASGYANIDLLPLNSLGSFTGFAILGGAIGDQSGASVSYAGDVNGDTIDDIIVGAFQASPIVDGFPRSTAGAAYVLFGRTYYTVGYGYFANIDLLPLTSVGSSLGFAILGAMAEDQCGRAVSAGGDINGDGVDDVVVGCTFADPVVGGVMRVNAGMAYVIFGRRYTLGNSAYTNIDLFPMMSSGSGLGFAVYGTTTNDYCGFSVSGAGDVNGDSVDDVIVGSFAADPVVGGVSRDGAGIVYVVYGRKYTTGVNAYTNVDLVTYTTGSNLGYRLLGVSVNDYTGRSVSRAGDVNKDGIGDFIIGADGVDIGAADFGMSYVIFGAIATPSSQPSSQPSRQPTSQPSRQPSRQPSSQPTGQPMGRPSSQPTVGPSGQPTGQPTRQPSTAPTTQPSMRPSSQPTVRPSGQPSRQPSSVPTMQPMGRPSSRPSSQPSDRPTSLSSSQPSEQPSAVPSAQPSAGPSSQSTSRPSMQPTGMPSVQPSSCPSTQPSSVPTSLPSAQPSSRPSQRPSTQSSVSPTSQPSTRPSTQPSSLPSTQPSAVPSVQPSVRPSAQPSSLPSTQPTSDPSGQPSALPSTQPSSVPSCQPTSVPSAQPVGEPTSQPSGQPVSSPSSQPSCQPSSQPSKQPASSPTTQPSTQPSSQPSSHPSVAPTGEWATVVSQTSLLTKVSYPDDHVWACGKNSGGISGALCVLAELDSGEIMAQYGLELGGVTSVLSTGSVGSDGSVVIMGQSSSVAGKSSAVASCVRFAEQLQCSVVSYQDSTLLAASYVPYPNKYVYVGWYNVHTSITVVDAVSGSGQSYIYTASNIKDFTLSQIQSPPYFVGSFVAGTAVRATATPVNYIVAGMVRTDAGILNAMILMPQVGEIVSSVDLVTTMALEVLGPDSFITGGLQLDDGIGSHAYLLRVNALYNTVQFGVRYRSVGSGGRRALGAVSAVRSVVRGVVLVDTSLFMIVDYTHNNVTSLTVLKTSITDGAIIKQVHITSPNSTGLFCTDITTAGEHVSIVCHTYNTATHLQSVLMLVDRNLSFEVLPEGFVRSEEDIFVTQTVAFRATALTITKSNVVVETTSSETTTGNQGPTRHPSAAPSAVSSAQPTSAPSAQPSSSPTAAPSVSARPTSQPSSASPTNTHKPTAAPTMVPTRNPSSAPTPRPSHGPTVSPTTPPVPLPSAVPRVVPTVKPSMTPSRSPVIRPSARPTVLPTQHPSTATTTTPSMEPSVSTVVESNSGSSMPPYVVGASVGGGLALLLVCGVLYQYYQNDKENKARELRKAEYYHQQALLAEQARIETATYIQEEEKRAAAKKAAQPQSNKQNRGGTKHNRKIGADAFSTVQDESEVEQPIPPLHMPSYSSSSSFDVSPLHSSEEGSVRRLLRHIVKVGSDSNHSVSDTSESDSTDSDT